MAGQAADLWQLAGAKAAESRAAEEHHAAWALRHPVSGSVIPLVDAACNIANLSGVDLERQLCAASAAGVASLVCLGTCRASSLAALALAHRRDELLRRGEGTPVRVFATVGLHPSEAAEWDDEAGQWIAALGADPLCVAVGECGVDYTQHDAHRRAEQRAALAGQIAIARALGKPLVLHVRGSALEGGDAHVRDVLAALQDGAADPQRCLVHSFTGGEAELRGLLAAGIAVCLPGRVCDAESGAASRAAVAACWKSPPEGVQLPLRIAMATDSPHLPPPAGVLEAARRSGFQFAAAAGSEPAQLPAVAAALGELTGRSAQAAAEQATRVVADALRLQRAADEAAAAARWKRPPACFATTNAKLCRQLRGLGVDVLLLQQSGKSLVDAALGCEAPATRAGQFGARGERVAIVNANRAEKKQLVQLRRGGCIAIHELRSTQVAEAVRELLSDERYHLAPERRDLCGRCVVCNSRDWVRQDRDEVRGDVPDSVREAHSEFWRCGGCRKVYWFGRLHDLAIQHFAAYLPGEHGEPSAQGPRSSPLAPHQQVGPVSCAARRAQQLDVELLVLCRDPLRGFLMRAAGDAGERLPRVQLTLPAGADGLEAQAAPVRQGAARALLQIASCWDVAPQRFVLLPVVSKRRFATLWLGEGDRAALRRAGPEWTFFSTPREAAAAVGGQAHISAVIKRLGARWGAPTAAPCDAPRRAALLCGADPDAVARAASLHALAAAEHELGDAMARRGCTSVRRLRWDWPAPGGTRGERPPPRVPDSDVPAGAVGGALRSWLEGGRLAGSVSLARAAAARAAVEDALRAAPSEAVRSARIWVFGSAASGSCDAGDRDADVDICVQLPGPLGRVGVEAPASAAERELEQAALRDLAAVAPLDERQLILHARVPLLRGRLRGDGVQIDLSLRYLGALNTRLLREYFAQAPWLRPLALVVRRWGTWSAVRAPDRGLPSSYCLALMLIAWLLRAGRLAHVPPTTDLGCEPAYATYPPADCAHPELGSLFLGFLGHYAWDFDWEGAAVCIAEPPQQPKAELGWADCAAAVRDPYERHVNLLRRLQVEPLGDLVRRFRLSHHLFANGAITDCFPPPPDAPP